MGMFAFVLMVSPATGADDDGRAGASIKGVLLAQASPDPVPAPSEGSENVRFEVRRYKVEGNTLLTQAALDRAVNPYIGKSKDFGDVQKALEAIQNAYADTGYAGVQVTLPEQELDDGEVEFNVVETKINKILVEGNEFFSAENIRRSVPTLVSGKTPNSFEIAESVRLANENPAKQSAVLLRASDREGYADAVIRVADARPLKYSVSLDNTGNSNTGFFRSGFAFQHANLFNRDHVLTAQYLTSTTLPDKVAVLGAGYRIPFYESGDSIDLVAGYSDVDSGTVQSLFTVTGKGLILALRYNKALRRWGDLEHKLTFGFDYRDYQNSVQPIGGGTNLVPDVTVHPLSITYAGAIRQTQQEWSFYASGLRNIVGGNDGRDIEFKASRSNGRAAYRVFRWGGTFARNLAGDYQARVQLHGQYTPDPLVAGEQFGIGGAESIRGFNERYYSSDKGYRGSVEFYTPDLGARTGVENARMRFLGFYDWGTAERNMRLPGELRGGAMDSVGVGMRISYKNNLSIRMDYAAVMHDGSQNGTVVGRANAKKWHTSIVAIF
jgi:hemolysin activation/secretion protein